MTSPLRWVFVDGLAHVLADSDDGTTLIPLTVCGLGMAATVTIYTVPPSLDMCWACVPLPGDDGSSPPRPLDVPPPVFGMPTVF